MGQTCLIWGTPAEVRRVNRGHAFWVQSRRAGGQYRISGQAAATIRSGYLDEVAKARLTTVLIDRRSEHEGVPIVDCTLVEEAKTALELQRPERAERLLKHIAESELSSPDHPVALGHPIVPEALAYSESWNDGQVRMLLQHLEGEGWLTVEGLPDEIQCTVTVSGHDHVAGAEEPIGREAFVAMWFDTSMNDAYKNGIEPGIRDAGFVPMRIDEKKDANRIDDDILEAIRQARFIVADMTHGSEGVRGSVYFEAGFARGCGLEIIYCCHRGCIDQLPFDTRQYHHIVWDTPEELRAELVERIRARIGAAASDAR